MGRCPCPCCCEGGCILFEDSFDRADDTDIGADWEEEAGDWSIDTNELTTSDSSAIVVTTDSFSPAYVVQVTCDIANGEYYSIVLGYVDGSNYCKVKFRRASSTTWYAYFYQNGSLLGSASKYRAGGWSTADTLRVCVSDGMVHAMVGATSLVFWVASYQMSVSPGGVGVATEANTPAAFDNFWIQKDAIDDSSCPTCYSCDTCDAPIPQYLEITFSDIANNNCVGCATKFSAPYILELYTPEQCRWRYYEPDWNCRTDCDPGDTTSLYIEAYYGLRTISGASHWVLNVEVSSCECCTPGISTSVYEALFYADTGVINPDKPPCTLPETLNLVRTTTYLRACNWSSASGTVGPA